MSKTVRFVPIKGKDGKKKDKYNKKQRRKNKVRYTSERVNN